MDEITGFIVSEQDNVATVLAQGLKGGARINVALGADRQHGLPTHVVSRDAVAEERADRPVLVELAREGRGKGENAAAPVRR